MDETIRARQDAVRRETVIGAAMNVVLGLVFFMLVFGWNRSATTWVALDFLPQTMGMTFIGGTVASLICLSRIAKGTLRPAGPVPTRSRQAIRVFGWAIAATLVMGGTVVAFVLTLAPADLGPGAVLAMKSLYGIVAGFVTTPPIVRMALGMPAWPSALKTPDTTVPGARA